MNNILNFAQIGVAITMTTLILLQQRGSGLGSAFGQEGGAYATRRGAQKKMLYATIFLGIAFVVLALMNLLL